jgi:hypothetical protein
MCTVSPNPAMLSGTSPTLATVTVTTTAKSEVTPPRSERRFDSPIGVVSERIGLIGYLAAPILLFGALRKWKKVIQWALASSILVAPLLSGCGGMGPSQNNSTSPSSSTPPGSYQLLVTASAAGATRTVTLMLNVQ